MKRKETVKKSDFVAEENYELQNKSKIKLKYKEYSHFGTGMK